MTKCQNFTAVQVADGAPASLRHVQLKLVFDYSDEWRYCHR